VMEVTSPHCARLGMSRGPRRMTLIQSWRMTTELLEQVQTALLNAMIRDIEGKKSAESVKAYAEAYVTLAKAESPAEAYVTLADAESPKKGERRRRDPAPTPGAD